MSDYHAPDFEEPRFREAPNARFEQAPADGVLPENFFATTNLPTYVKVSGEWRLPDSPRMDAAIALDDDETLRVVEGRLVTRGELIAIGTAEDGSQGIYVNAHGFLPDEVDAGFQIMGSPVSHEKPVDYARLAGLMIAERERGGRIVWVIGPAALHARGRDEIVWFIDNGFVHALLGGNAIAVHDIEQALMGTTVGMNQAGRPVAGAQSFPMRAINRIAAAGSIGAAVEKGILTEGVMHACVKKEVPFVLAGSIRDDGPLPDTVTDLLAAQAMMREHAKAATMVVMIATAVHSIAFGNMLPSFVADAGAGAGVGEAGMRPLTTIVVDSSEFVVNKLKDRGAHHAFGAITNAQDFLHVLRHFVEKAASS